jgi:adenylate cyclase
MAKFGSGHNAHAQELFRQAIELSPCFSAGYRGLSLARAQCASLSHTDDLGEVLKSAEAAARQAVSLDGSDAESRACLSFALCQCGEYESALAEAERALSLSPDLASGHATLGGALVFSGRPVEGIIALETAIKLDPCAPMLPNRLTLLAVGLYFAREYETGVEAAKRAIVSSADYPLAHRWLAAALGRLGRIAEAERAFEKAIAIDLFDKYVRRRVPWHRPEDHAHMIEILRKAGWRH